MGTRCSGQCTHQCIDHHAGSMSTVNKAARLFTKRGLHVWLCLPNRLIVWVLDKDWDLKSIVFLF